MNEEWVPYYGKYSHGLGSDPAPMARFVRWANGEQLVINRAARDALGSDRVCLSYRRDGRGQDWIGIYPASGERRGLVLSRGHGHLWRLCACGFCRRFGLDWPHGCEIELFHLDGSLVGILPMTTSPDL